MTSAPLTPDEVYTPVPITNRWRTSGGDEIDAEDFPTYGTPSDPVDPLPADSFAGAVVAIDDALAELASAVTVQAPFLRVLFAAIDRWTQLYGSAAQRRALRRTETAERSAMHAAYRRKTRRRGRRRNR